MSTKNRIAISSTARFLLVDCSGKNGFLKITGDFGIQEKNMCENKCFVKFVANFYSDIFN
jgi:hypothetical protein